MTSVSEGGRTVRGMSGSDEATREGRGGHSYEPRPAPVLDRPAFVVDAADLEILDIVEEPYDGEDSTQQ